MGLKDPRAVFGVHSVAPYNRDSKELYGIVKVLASSSLSLSAEQVDLTGGSNKYPYASEDGKIAAELSLKMGQMEDFMFELFLGKAPTKLAASAAGAVSTAANAKGTSMIAATGLLSPTVIPTTGAAKLRFGKYVIKAVSTTAFDVFCASDVDLSEVSYIDDSLKVASVTGVATGNDSDVVELGLRFTGGASATAFVVGDTASFEVLPPHDGGMEVLIGNPSDVLPEFGCVIMAQKRASKELFEVDAFRVKGSGMPLGFESFQWAQPEVKAKVLFDSTRNAAFGVRTIKRK